MTDSLVYLGYVISAEATKVDTKKVQSIVDWPRPQSIHDVRSFHGLASFYQRFIRNFNTIVAPITNCLKFVVFTWSNAAESSFQQLMKAMTEALVLALLDFGKAFEVDRDASRVGVGVVLSQESRHIAFFSEKLNDIKRRYSTYDVKFYAIIRAL